MHRIAALAALLCSSAAVAGPHVMKWRDPEEPRALRQAVQTASIPHLNYYGGPVIAQVKVYAVYWGGNVDATTQSKIGGFYDAFTQSGVFGWLSEYDTNLTAQTGQTGTNQHFKHGSFAGEYTIAPATTSTALTDAQIQTEIAGQLKAGKLPAPDADTLFMIHFPKGVSISISGANSCKSGGFCAYHSTMPAAVAGTPGNVYYAIIPDESAGSGCDTGCGDAPAMFDNLTSVASHELIEAVTDPEVGLVGNTYGPPLAWYDPQGSNGEIGDICNAEQATFTAGSGVKYTMQKEWSNSAGSCIGASVDDYSFAVAPAKLSLNAGQTGTFQVTTALTRGAAQSIKLSVDGMTSDISASISPSTITSGQSATVTITTSGSSINGAHSFSIVATGSNTAHTADVDVEIAGGDSNHGCPAGDSRVLGLCVPFSCDQTGASGTAWSLVLACVVLAMSERRRRLLTWTSSKQ